MPKVKIKEIMKKRIRLQGILVFSSVIASIFLSKYLFQNWKEKIFDEFWDVIGIIIILLGFLLRVVARGYKEEKSFASKKLVKGGPYSLMRNPMYLGTLLIGLGVVMVIFQWWVFLLFAAVFFLIYFPQVKSEEKMLLGHFGEEYSKYCKNTPRYLPKLILRIKEGWGCMRFKWAWIKSEGVSLVVILSLVIFAEVWKDARLFGSREYWKEAVKSLGTIIIVGAIIIGLFHEKECSGRTK